MREMVESGEAVENSPGEGGRRDPGRNEHAGNTDAAHGDIGESQLAHDDQRVAALDAEDDLGRVAGLNDLPQSGDEQPHAHRPEYEPAPDHRSAPCCMMTDRRIDDDG